MLTASLASSRKVSSRYKPLESILDNAIYLMFSDMNWSCCRKLREWRTWGKTMTRWFRCPIRVSRYLWFVWPFSNISLVLDHQEMNLYSISDIKRRLVSRRQPRKVFSSSRPASARILVTYIRSFLCMGSLYFNGIPSMWMFGYTSGSYLLRLLPI